MFPTNTEKFIRSVQRSLGKTLFPPKSQFYTQNTKNRVLNNIPFGIFLFDAYIVNRFFSLHNYSFSDISPHKRFVSELLFLTFSCILLLMCLN